MSYQLVYILPAHAAVHMDEKLIHLFSAINILRQKLSVIVLLNLCEPVKVGLILSALGMAEYQVKLILILIYILKHLIGTLISHL